jgi:hypothetical protein
MKKGLGFPPNEVRPVPDIKKPLDKGRGFMYIL